MPMKLAALILPILTLTLGVTVPTQAGFLTNGSFEQYTNTTSSGTNGAPSQLGNSGTGGYSSLAGWTVGSGTYGFLMNGAADKNPSYSPQFGNNFSIWGKNNGGVNTVSAASPDGGNYLALDGGSNYHGAGISQTITGLTAGQQYVVSFDWASGQQYGYTGATTESLQVGFGNQVQNTITANNVSEGYTDWQQVSFRFTADGVSDTLNFLANGTPGGEPPIVLLDGLTFAAVPEPGSLALLGIGVVVTAAVRRVRRGPSPAA